MQNNDTNNSNQNADIYGFQNDILALSRAFSLPEIDYTDISQREQLASALKRWPLLAELTHQ
ncbi:cellulose biosynthesis protein BcsR [Siccibacter colletis]|uniref:YhjR family protein n=1 Tax=Siccibacter colletis TaxID=1505757 RepID=A0ABY6JE37_9ENTR|nr:cellulose biosynthesis protein BcsR [Siccibacter colletis]UYU32097.1 YhjR family protein [Siccibacter colletis]WNN48699.1 cellulose biosynthesis protein BcsR [Siccibacter colletis]